MISLDKYALSAWAKQLPASAWKPGLPPQTDNGYFAVKTQTGRILVGKAKVLQPESLNPSYGHVVAYVKAGG